MLGLVCGRVQFVSVHDMLLAGARIVEHLFALEALILALVLPLCECEERLLFVAVTNGLKECLVAAISDGVIVVIVIAGVVLLPIIYVASVP